MTLHLWWYRSVKIIQTELKKLSGRDPRLDVHMLPWWQMEAEHHNAYVCSLLMTGGTVVAISQNESLKYGKCADLCSSICWLCMLILYCIMFSCHVTVTQWYYCFSIGPCMCSDGSRSELNITHKRKVKVYVFHTSVWSRTDMWLGCVTESF